MTQDGASGLDAPLLCRLTHHDNTGFDGNDVAIFRLIGAGTGTDIDQASCVAQRRPNSLFEEGIFTPPFGIAAAYVFIAQAITHHRHRPKRVG